MDPQGNVAISKVSRWMSGFVSRFFFQQRHNLILSLSNRYQISIQRCFHHTTQGPKGSCIATYLYHQICTTNPLVNHPRWLCSPCFFWAPQIGKLQVAACAWLVMSSLKISEVKFQTVFYSPFRCTSVFLLWIGGGFTEFVDFFPFQKLGLNDPIWLGHMFFFPAGGGKKIPTNFVPPVFSQLCSSSPDAAALADADDADVLTHRGLFR